MIPQNFEKWFGFVPTEYMEIHVHSVLVRDRNVERRGFYDPTFAPIDHRERLEVEPFYEVGMSLRDPSDTLMTRVFDEVLTMDHARFTEFCNDLIPLTDCELARILYAEDPEAEAPGRKRRNGDKS